MNEKKTRYGTRVFTLDRISNIYLWCWNEMDIKNFLEKENYQYGLKIINEKCLINIRVVYTNITWEYKLYFGSFKKKYKALTNEDDRWNIFEKYIASDLKVIGLEFLAGKIISNLKAENYFEYHCNINKQFKNYCI